MGGSDKLEKDPTIPKDESPPELSIDDDLEKMPPMPMAQARACLDLLYSGCAVRMQRLKPRGPHERIGLAVFVRSEGQEQQVCEVRLKGDFNDERHLPWAALVGAARAIGMVPIRHKNGLVRMVRYEPPEKGDEK